MPRVQQITLAIVSDIHYASVAEQARGTDYELRGVAHPLLRFLLRCYRHFIWKRNPLNQNYLLDDFIAAAAGVDFVIANGDYSCNSGFVGVSDDAACASARECLAKLRREFAQNVRATIGDHELGKLSFFGGQGGMRLASWRRARTDLNLEPFWQLEIGNYVLLGLTSSIIALPVFEPDTLPAERSEWQQIREQHLQQIRDGFNSIPPSKRILLFCHDPTALPFLWEELAVRAKLTQLEQTFIGHLHSNLVFWKSKILAGIPPIHFLGHTPRRLSTALHQARRWRPFKVRLCPALGGIELLKDGGFYTARLDPSGMAPAQFQFHPLKPRPTRESPQ